MRNKNGFQPFLKANGVLEDNGNMICNPEITQKNDQGRTKGEYIFSDMQSLKHFISHTFFLRTLLKDMTYQKEGINSEKGTRKKPSGEPHRREVRVTPGEEAQALRNVPGHRR